MRYPLLSALSFALAAGACTADEGGAPASGSLWRLDSIDGTPFAARATLGFPEPGLIAGKAPCNSYGGELTASAPGFGIGPLRVTRMACGDLEAERQFFQTLGAMAAMETQGDQLILSAPDGTRMVFSRAQP